MIIIGIDPGLAHTGWGVIEATPQSCRAIAYGFVSTDTKQPVQDRLAAIYHELLTAFESYEPEACAIEGVFFGINAQSAFALGQARGVALLAAAKAGVECYEYSPAQVKSTIVGNGRAEKSQVAYMVKMLLSLDHDPKPDHCSDALAIALTHSTSGNH